MPCGGGTRHTLRTRSWDAATGVAETNFFVAETCCVGRAVVSGLACRIWPHSRFIGYSEEDGGGLRGSPSCSCIKALVELGRVFCIWNMPRWPRFCIWASLLHLAAFTVHRILRRGWRWAKRKPIFVAALGLWLSWDAFSVSETGPIGPSSVSGA